MLYFFIGILASVFGPSLSAQNTDLIIASQNGTKGKFIGVWKDKKESECVIVGDTWSEFTKRWKDLSENKGFRLIDLNIVTVGGKTSYNGIFQKGSGKYALFQHKSWDDFTKKWKELSGQGQRLIDIETFVDGGKRYYTGVYRGGSGKYALYQYKSWGDFTKKWKELSEQGQRLIDIETFTSGGKQYYTGVFQEGSGKYALFQYEGWDKFTDKWEELNKEDQRLIDVETFKSGGKTYYATAANYDQVKADPDLAELHRKFAWITTIDDHEVTNDTWSAGAENHQPGEGPYVDRRNAAYQAYLEWMPIRLDVPATPAETRLYRRFQFGQLADLLLLDLRQYRDQQGGAAEAYLAGRQMTGTDQYDWLTTQLADTTSHQWRLIGNSVQFMRVVYPFAGFAPNGDGTYRNFDAWDGYGTQRAALQSVLAGHASDYDAVFLTGDIHSTWASELPLWSGAGAPTGGSVGVEFVCTSVTSDNLNEILGQPPRNPTSLFLEGGILSANPHIKLLEFDSHGCSVVEVTDAYTQCDWYYTSDRTSNTATVSHAFSYRTMAGTKTVAAAPGRIVDDCLPPVEVPEFSGPAVLPLVAVAGVGAALALRRRAEQPATA